jgi:hypothetical protein
MTARCDSFLVMPLTPTFYGNGKAADGKACKKFFFARLKIFTRLKIKEI